MVFVRVTIVRENLDYLKKAVCIAVRYSAVRRQSELYPGKPEPQIMDYKTQQEKLFVPLSKVFAFHFTSVALFDNYIHLQDVIDDGKEIVSKRDSCTRSADFRRSGSRRPDFRRSTSADRIFADQDFCRSIWEIRGPSFADHHQIFANHHQTFADHFKMAIRLLPTTPNGHRIRLLPTTKNGHQAFADDGKDYQTYY